MYDELVKRLRELQFLTEHCSEHPCFECENRELCDKNDNKTLSGTYKEAAEAIEELSKPRWIPVAERLPERGQNVLVANKRGKQWDIDKAWLSCLGSGFDRCGKRTLYNVTHWMPLPKAPEEG